jgi:hypothetical protein
MSSFAAKFVHARTLNVPGFMAAVENNRANHNANRWRARA